MRYLVYSDNKSWVLVSNDEMRISAATLSKNDRFNLGKGIRCAVARLVNCVTHPQTADLFVQTIPVRPDLEDVFGNSYFIGIFETHNFWLSMAKAMFNVYLPKTEPKRLWRVVEKTARFINVRKVA